MEILIILITLVLLLALIMGVESLSRANYDFVGFVLIASIVLAFIVLVATLCLKYEPKVIDVYRGDTTLERTYRDGIPIDSMVVWKEGYKQDN